MVEFAMTIPLLVLLLFAIVQYGFLFAAHITVRNASAVGARHAALHEKTMAEAEAVARQAVSPMLNPAVAQAVGANVTVAGSPAISMTVTYQLPLIVPFVVPGGGKSRAIAATTVMR